MNSELIIKTAQETKDNYFVALLGQETEHQFSLRVQDIVPGQGSPIHLHEEQSETFHVITGNFRFKVGDREIVGEPGMTVYIPKNTPHAYLYEDVGQQEQGKLLSILAPGLHDGFIKKIPEAESQGASQEELSNIAEQFGAKIVGPKLAEK